MRCLRLPIVLFWLCLLLPASSREPVTAVVVVEGLTWQQVEQGTDGALYVMARHGAAGMMSVATDGDARVRFALTLQTGKRYRPLRDAGLMDALADAGVRVTVHHEPPDEPPVLPLRLPSESSRPEASMQIWWIRAQPGDISRALEKAIGALNPERDRVLIVGLPLKGERLAPVIAAGSGLSTGVLTSDTTQTLGLISDEDLFPTLLHWHGIAPRQGQHPIRVVRDDNGFVTVQALWRRSAWNARGLIPVGVLQVGGGLLAVLWALRRLQQRAASRRADLLLSVAIGSLLSLPAGTVLAPHLPASTLWQYVGAIVLSAAWLSLLAHWGAWHEPFRAYIRACALSAVVVMVDGVAGQHGVRLSIYSAYSLTGIRFYGIGNELMGVLVGCALAWGLYGLPAFLRGALWLGVAVVLANPAWGANLGGLLTAMVGLGSAWEANRVHGKRLAGRVMGWFAAGVAIAGVVMWLDSLRALPSHLGETWLSWRGEGINAVLDTLLSKLALMARVLLSPFAWGVLAVIAVALYAMHRYGTLSILRNGWHSDMVGWLACMATAFLFNDSGFVPAAAILGVGLGATLTRRLEEVYRDSSA